jgi:hypothetical protein
MTLATPITVIRGRFLDIQKTVAQANQIADQVRYLEDGVLITEQGKIRWWYNQPKKFKMQVFNVFCSCYDGGPRPLPRYSEYGCPSA